VLSDPNVGFVTTTPGHCGEAVAWLAEFLISLLLFFSVLHVSGRPRLSSATPFVAGALVAAFITVEAPLSGMSMNPARTIGSALAAGDWRGIWIYLTAPPLGMLAAAELYLHLPGPGRVMCARLCNHGRHRCIFCSANVASACPSTMSTP
jgi:aquaporin Z